MKPIKLLALLIGLSMIIWWACSDRETAPTAPEPSACLVQPHGLNKTLADYSSAEFIFLGDPNGPQPASISLMGFTPSGDPQSPQPAKKITWYGDCEDYEVPGTADTWYMWNCTIDCSDLADNCLYTEVGNESDPSTCQEMTLKADLFWRPYPFTGKWQRYAYLPEWTVYDRRGQMAYGTYVWRDTWESKCISTHKFLDKTNKPDSASFTLRSQFRSLSPQSIVKQ
ncbi:MAG: hypothetical protein ONB13_08115 [candidate division KSB1 bacterium]|nr:hypothetical protein [candidate division KSB1 bacterium]MDZ7335642.1 hypothetical protein [candidate division KSB1 bacterium]MDZ7376572.1 hypothetical protein [candidate division KSB1 bacterium]MDZ7399834.1 hypothetical protein [candidate division KSB1 bacterium]